MFFGAWLWPRTFYLAKQKKEVAQMLAGLLKVSGMLVLRLVYGKKYAEKHSEKFGLMILLSLANIFWLLSVLFLVAGITASDAVICAIMAIGYPVAIAIWTVLERKKQE